MRESRGGTHRLRDVFSLLLLKPRTAAVSEASTPDLGLLHRRMMLGWLIMRVSALNYLQPPSKELAHAIGRTKVQLQHEFPTHRRRLRFAFLFRRDCGGRARILQAGRRRYRA